MTNISYETPSAQKEAKIMDLISKLKLVFEYDKDELEKAAAELRSKKFQEELELEKTHLNLCKKHQQRSPGTFYAEHNCDFCKKTKTESKIIDMVLYCPYCGLQHIDEPDERTGWDNPPHRSHLCNNCEFIWRPADVCTNGVKMTKTKGKADSKFVINRIISK